MNTGRKINKKVAPNNSSNIAETSAPSKDPNSQIFRNELGVPLSFFLVGVDHHADICHLIQVKLLERCLIMGIGKWGNIGK